MDFQCKICFTRRSTSTEIRQHGLDDHIPQEHVEYRYPFSQSHLRVIASRNEDRYNSEVRPRALPLRDGICILRESLLNDPEGALGLNWYIPTPAPSADHQKTPLPAPPKPEAKRCRTSPTLDCQICWNPGCTMVCGSAAMEAITSIAKTTATRFQMQQATDLSSPLPFPTVKEAPSMKTYGMAITRGLPSPPATNALMRETGMEMKDI